MISVPEKAKVAGEWRKLFNEVLHDRYCPQNNVRVTILKRICWAVHVACMENRMHKGVGWGNL